METATATRKLRQQRPADRSAVLRALDLFDRKHPLKLTRESYALPEVAAWSRSIRALTRDLDERDAAHTVTQRQHLDGRVLRSADACAQAARRLGHRRPWIAGHLYRLAFRSQSASWQVLRREIGSEDARKSLTALRFALRIGLDDQVADEGTGQPSGDGESW